MDEQLEYLTHPLVPRSDLPLATVGQQKLASSAPEAAPLLRSSAFAPNGRK